MTETNPQTGLILILSARREKLFALRVLSTSPTLTILDWKVGGPEGLHGGFYSCRIRYKRKSWFPKTCNQTASIEYIWINEIDQAARALTKPTFFELISLQGFTLFKGEGDAH
jgi:hypothetical protein